MIPRPVATTPATVAAVRPEPASRGPTPPSAFGPWQTAQAVAKTCAPAAASPVATSAAGAAEGSKGCQRARP